MSGRHSRRLLDGAGAFAGLGTGREAAGAAPETDADDFGDDSAADVAHQLVEGFAGTAQLLRPDRDH